ncbi:MAG: hypothetical protein IKG74_00640 [Firmicutes bacterium]|nr:hypothetical protein [Bacillota bacterium]
MANPLRPSHKIKPGGKTQSGQSGQGGRTIGVKPLTQADGSRTARHNAGHSAGQTAERILSQKPNQNTASTLRPNPVVKPAHTVSRQTSAPVRPTQTSPQAQAAQQLEQLMRNLERPATQQAVNTAAATAHTAKSSLGKAVRTGVALGAGSALLGALLSGAMRSGQSLQDLQKMPELQGYSQEELRRAMEEYEAGAAPAEASDPFASAVECSHCGAVIPAGVRVCEYCDCPRTGEEEKL